MPSTCDSMGCGLFFVLIESVVSVVIVAPFNYYLRSRLCKKQNRYIKKEAFETTSSANDALCNFKNFDVGQPLNCGSHVRASSSEKEMILVRSEFKLGEYILAAFGVLQDMVERVDWFWHLAPRAFHWLHGL